MVQLQKEMCLINRFVCIAHQMHDDLPVTLCIGQMEKSSIGVTHLPVVSLINLQVLSSNPSVV